MKHFYSMTLGIFQMPLFSSSGHQNMEHTVVITNAETNSLKGILDINFIREFVALVTIPSLNFSCS
jgi:hypothetical protein